MAFHVNDKAYTFGTSRKAVTVTLEIALDMIPGWGDKIEDHIQQLFLSDRYVVSATTQEP